MIAVGVVAWSRVKLRSPTQVCGTFRYTLRSVRLKLSGTVIVSDTSVGSSSGMATLGLAQMRSTDGVCTVSTTGTTTRSVPLPGPGIGVVAGDAQVRGAGAGRQAGRVEADLDQGSHVPPAVAPLVGDLAQPRHVGRVGAQIRGGPHRPLRS